MAQQVYFFKKNNIDLDFDNISITVTDSVAVNTGQDFVGFLRNRNNLTSWMTTGSSDAGTTTMIVDTTDLLDLSRILLIRHNLKAFTIKYWNGASYVDFSTPINETINTDQSTLFTFDQVETSMIQIVITGTQVADEDKQIRQLILTTPIGSGQFEGWPIIKKPTIGTRKRENTMLSGKKHIIEGIETFSTRLSVSNWKIDGDLDMIESIYSRRQGVLMWLSGGDEAQFSTIRKGYRKEDIFLVRPTDDYTNPFVQGLYQSGNKIDMDLEETIT